MSGATNLLARSYRVDVSTDGSSWLTLNGLNDFNPEISPTMQDSSDYESDGWSASEITMQGWKLTVKVNAKATAGVVDPALSLVLSCIGQFGDAARVYVRWYRKDGATGFPSYSGRAIVEATPSKTGVPDLNEYQVVLTGDGKLSTISNPYSGGGSAPTVSAASPSGAAGGEQVTITGSGFTGTVASTGVKFGATAATEWVVLGDSVIVAVVPTGSAGSAAITVTNAVGTSAAFAYTRGA